MKNKTIAFLACFFLLLASILSIVDFWCFNEEFYIAEYNKLDTANNIGFSENDLNTATVTLLDYLRDYNKTLDLKLEVKGEVREVFNEREKAHMVDVRDLYFNVMIVRNISLGLSLFFFIILAYIKGLNCLYRAYLKSLSCFGAIFGLIGLFCLIDFDSFWTYFHHIFFAGNDLWLLNPRTDILIMMVPGEFFFSLCTTIVFSVFIIMLFYFLILLLLKKKVFSK